MTLSLGSLELGEILFGVHGGLSVVGLLLFMARSSHEPVKSRNRVIVIVQTLGSVGYFASLVFANSVDNVKGAPGCAVGYFLFPLGIPVMVMV